MRTLAILFAAAALAAAQTPAASAQKAKANAATNIAGTWGCEVNYQGSPIDVVLHVSKDKSGALTGSMDNVTEPGGPALDASLTLTAGKLHVDVPGLPSSFDGTLNSASNGFDGAWQYNGETFACTMQKEH